MAVPQFFKGQVPDGDFFNTSTVRYEPYGSPVNNENVDAASLPRQKRMEAVSTFIDYNMFIRNTLVKFSEQRSMPTDRGDILTRSTFGRVKRA